VNGSKTASLFLFAILTASQPALAQGPAEAKPDPPSVVSVFTDLGRDLRHLASRDSALILGAAGVASLAVKQEDRAITHRASQSQPLDTALDQGALIGDGATQVGAAVAVYGLGRAFHSTVAASLGADLLQAQIVNGLLTQTVKYAVNRTRPDGGRYSFPSGHSSATFATATVLVRHFGWRVGVPAYALAGYVAASRLSENRHFASDVIFGAGIGMVSGRAMTIRKGNAALTVTPLPIHGGGGVWITIGPSTMAAPDRTTSARGARGGSPRS
jgi:membrane-associated phospholipid phosphatase